MKMINEKGVRASGPPSGEYGPEVQYDQRTLAVLSVEPLGGSMEADRINALCEDIPGVGALWVDAARGRVHVLYDGTVEAIEQVENAVRISGHRIRFLGDKPLSQPAAPAGEFTP